MKQHSTLEKAKVRLLIDQPFFASLLMKKEIVVYEKDAPHETAWVDRAGRLHFNGKWLSTLSVDEVMFVLAHEVMHVVYAHLARMGDRDQQLWNVACDAVINDLLQAEHVGRMVDGGVRMQGASSRTAEEIYEELMYNAQQKPQSGGGSPSSGTGGPIIADVLKEEAQGMTPSEASQAIAEGKQDIAQGLSAMKIAGKLGGSLAQRFREYLESKVPWFTILERYMTAKVERHQTWNRPNKRYAGRFYLPRRERQPGMGEIVIQVDTSGSITDKDIGAFLGHMDRLVAECNPEKVHLLFTTTEVQWEKTFARGEPILPPDDNWSGGTAMTAGFEWAEQNAPDADLVVTFTDGYTPYPEHPDVDSIWVMQGSHEDAPVGTTVRY